MAEVFGYALPLVLTAAGVALVVAEALAPGAHLIVLGVALLVAGLLGLLVPALAGPIAAAAVVLAVGAASLHVYRNVDLYPADGSAGIGDSGSLAGEEGVVTETVTPNSGRVRLRNGGFDPVYSARSVDGEIAEGTEVIVVDPGGGSVLLVEAIVGVDEIDRELARGRTATREGDDGDDEREPEPG